MSNRIQRYVQGTFNTFGCNLNCSYCYLKLKGLSNIGESFPYKEEHIARAMSVKRWGVCYISLTGDGETLLSEKTVNLAHLLLKEGHYLNIINNGTQKHSLEYMCSLFDEDCRARTMLTFSLHYLELKSKGLLDLFFENIRMMRDKGFTVYIHMVLCDEYIPHIEEIKELCLRQVGFLPQLGMIRNETSRDDERRMSDYSQEEYYRAADAFHSPYFEMQKRLYEENCAGDYCYAGRLGVLLNFTTGVMRQCVANDRPVNVFDDIDSEIPFEEVGKGCRSPWCYCSTFQIFGMIPGKDYPSYRRIFEGGGNPYLSDSMKNALSVKLSEDYLSLAGKG